MHFRTILHERHATTLPVFPNGSAQCAACHGTHDVTEPPARDHPFAQVLPSRDWSRACAGCHASNAALAHSDTMTSSLSGYESCPTCHAADREEAVARVHKAR